MKTFLAFSGGPHPPRDCRSTPQTLETGVEYDIAAEIDEKNGWVEPGGITDEAKQAMIEVATRGLSELILFCFDGQTLDPRGKGLRTALRRFLSVCWALRSDKLVDKKGKPLSLDKLSRLPQVRCTRCTLSLLAQEFGKKWDFRVRVQKRETTKLNYAMAARLGWVARRARIAEEKKELERPSRTKKS